MKTIEIKLFNASGSESFELCGVALGRGEEKSVVVPIRTANRLVIAASKHPHITVQVMPDGDVKINPSEQAVIASLTAENEQLKAENEQLKAAKLADSEPVAEPVAAEKEPKRSRKKEK